MRNPLLRRRFGHGAARLPIGGSTTGPSLSQIARAPVSRERGFAMGPGLVCAGLALLLASAVVREQPAPMPLADAATQTLEMRLWSETPTTPQREKPEPIALQAPEAEPIAAAPVPETPETAPAPTPFDPASLAMRAPVAPAAAGDIALEPARAGVRPDSGRPVGRGGARPRPPLAIPAPLAAPIDAGMLSSTAPSSTPAARPSGPSSPNGRERSDWTADTERQAFLVARAESDDADDSRPAAPDARPRPPVSARPAATDLDWDALRAGGWHEVPLDELPDCTPAGRQDLLKKRILLAAPFERECSHQDGSYRFVETRNLGAFLMWSRPNPDRPTASDRDRDVCDVLERALRCLGGSSIEESTAR